MSVMGVVVMVTWLEAEVGFGKGLGQAEQADKAKADYLIIYESDLKKLF